MRGIALITALLLLTVAGPADAARRTAGGKKISSRFCALDDQNRCDWPGYASFLLTVVVPLLVLAGLSLVCAPILGCLRMVGCMGGKASRKGLCCARGEEKEYSPGVRKGVKVGGLIVVVACFACLVAAYVGNGKVTQGVKGVWEAMISAGETLGLRVGRISDTLGSLPYSTSASTAALAEAGRSVATFVRDMDSAKGVIIKYEVIRAVFANLSLLIPFLLLALSVLLGWLNKKGCGIHIIIATLIMLSLAFVWFSTAVHSLFAILFDDACDEFEGFIAGTNSRNILDTLVKCSGPDGFASGFSGLLTEATSGLSQATDVACNAISPSCSPGANPQLTNCPPGTCSSTTLPGYRDAVWTPSPNTNNAPLTVSQCATQCVADSPEHSRSVAATSSIDDVDAYQNVIDTEIGPLTSCDFLDTLARDLFSSFCTKLTSGLVLVARSQIAMASFLICGILCLWLGQKRFLPMCEPSDDYQIEGTKSSDQYALQPV